MRTIEEVTKDLNYTLNDVSVKKNEMSFANVKADELKAEASKITAAAQDSLTSAQTKAIEYRKEYEEIINSLIPELASGRVRQS
jgi:hypothetical protein